MVLEFPYCTFKCGKDVCQNSQLENKNIINTSVSTLVNKYINNPITESVVCQGLEPMDSFEELIEFIRAFRELTDDDVVVFTGYNEDEVVDKIYKLQKYKNIIVKFGRYVPNRKSQYDDLLGVTLMSSNQYAKQIS